MTELITNKATRALNKYPPDGNDMGVVAKDVKIIPIGSKNGYTGYNLPDGKFRCVPTADLSPIVVPPPVEPPEEPDPELPLPNGDGRLYQVLELVGGSWVSRGYFQEVATP